MRAVYPSFLRDAVQHAERLVAVLESLDPRAGREAASTWLLGRSGEVDCLIHAFITDWRIGRLSEIQTALAINDYLGTLHRGLATYFGELAPPCCISSLVVTAARAPFETGGTAVHPLIDREWISSNVTWSEVSEEDIVATEASSSLQHDHPSP